MSGTFTSILCVVIAAIQLAFPLIGQHGFQGKLDLTLDGLSYGIEASADTGVGTLDTQITAAGLPMFTLHGDTEGASIGGISGNAVLTAAEALNALTSGLSEGAQLRDWRDITDYLTDGRLTADLALIGAWLQTFSLPTPVLLVEDGALCYRYNFTAADYNALIESLYRDTQKTSRASEQLKGMQLWALLGIDGHAAVTQLQATLGRTLVRQLYMFRYTSDLAMSLTLVTDCGVSSASYHTPNIIAAKLRILSGSEYESTETDWTITLSADGLFGIVTYAGEESAAFSVVCEDDAFVVKTDVKPPYDSGSYALAMTLGDSLAGTLSYQGEAFATFFGGMLGGVFVVDVTARSPRSRYRSSQPIFDLRMTLGDPVTPFTLKFTSADRYSDLPSDIDLTLSEDQLDFSLDLGYGGLTSGSIYLLDAANDSAPTQLHAIVNAAPYIWVADVDLTDRTDGLTAAWRIDCNDLAMTLLATDTGSLDYRATSADSFADTLSLAWTAYGETHTLTGSGDYRWH